MDVIVLGGGLMGTASAYFLARRGASVERSRWNS
nr:FAD-dependent oxidoreductase [Mesorhizobium sp. B2-4-14]